MKKKKKNVEDLDDLEKCSQSDTCIAYEPEAVECQKENGCMTEENVKAYLEWCARALGEQGDDSLWTHLTLLLGIHP